MRPGMPSVDEGTTSIYAVQHYPRSIDYDVLVVILLCHCIA